MRRVLALVAAIVSTTALAACVGAADDSRQDATAQLPQGVSVDVYQTRTDLAARKLEIAVANASDADLTITGAQFVSSQFAAPALWAARPAGSVVRAGFGIDLPVSLPEPACDDPAPEAIVRIEFTTADGRVGLAELPAVDRYDRLPAMRAQECLAVSIAAVAGLQIDGPIRVAEVGDALVGFVPVTIAPTGAGGSFTIDLVEDTVLLALADEGAATVQSLPLGLRIDAADAPGSFEIPVLPGRCDPHAIAEDKQGTIFLLDVTAPDGTNGRIGIPASAGARASIYDYVARACGLPR